MAKRDKEFSTKRALEPATPSVIHHCCVEMGLSREQRMHVVVYKWTSPG